LETTETTFACGAPEGQVDANQSGDISSTVHIDLTLYEHELSTDPAINNLGPCLGTYACLRICVSASRISG